MLLSAVSVLVVAQSSSEIPEGLMNNPVFVCVCVVRWVIMTAYVCVCVCVCVCDVVCTIPTLWSTKMLMKVRPICIS